MALAFKKEVIEVTIAIFVLFGMAFGANEYFAKSSDVLFVKASQQLHFTSHAIQEIQGRMWRLEERNGSDNCYKWTNSDDREEYKRLKDKLDKLRKQEDQLIKQTTGKGG